MFKKIMKNSICPLCNSGLKYKDCCGKNEGLKGESWRYIGDKKSRITEFEKRVFEKLGHYPDDYIDPIKTLREVIYVLTDESNNGDYFAVGSIVVLKSEVDRHTNIKAELKGLVERYNLDYIHCTDIFGHKKVLGHKRRAFIEEYISIIKGLDLKPFSVCMSKEELKSYLNIKSITNEQCYIALIWIMMFDILKYLIYRYGNELIIEIWRENENITLDKRILHQENIRGIIAKFPFAHISIYQHYILFMKEEILFSSLTDLIAYLTAGICPKINKRHAGQLANNYYDLLIILKEIFTDISDIRIEGLEHLLDLVKNRERYR